MSVASVWDIQISIDTLNSWPEEGELCDINRNLVVLERDENGNIVNDDESAEEASLHVSVPVDSDGGTLGRHHCRMMCYLMKRLRV